jgi:hypothetical protein
MVAVWAKVDAIVVVVVVVVVVAVKQFDAAVVDVWNRIRHRFYDGHVDACP